MNIVEINVRPRRLRSGKYTLYEVTEYDQRVPGKSWIRLQKRIVWPMCKQSNGLGKRFNCGYDAIEFFVTNRLDDVEYGLRTMAMIERHTKITGATQ